jgi:hypothetical protein
MECTGDVHKFRIIDMTNYPNTRPAHDASNGFEIMSSNADNVIHFHYMQVDPIKLNPSVGGIGSNTITFGN